MSNKYRIIKRKYKGFDCYVVQEKLLWWWSDFEAQHVGNNSVDRFGDEGYYHIEAARKQFERLTAHVHVSDEVVK